MGIFSKKTLICENCGKEYKARITIGKHICDECFNRIYEKEKMVKGYVDYAKSMYMDEYSEKELDDILRHRTAILEKYKIEDAISKDQLLEISKNYKKLTDDEAATVLIKTEISKITAAVGSSITNQFFIPGGFSKTVVDKKDVFAVGYTTDKELSGNGVEAILVVMFTNDPYLPVITMNCASKLGLFELGKSKKVREIVESLFQKLCPNLSYPIQDIELLQKQIEKDGAVKGDIDIEKMESFIKDALRYKGVFDLKYRNCGFDMDFLEILEQYGYMLESDISDILKFDSMFQGKYWKKQATRLFDKEKSNQQ